MPDIALCANQTCPSRMECLRYRAKPSQRQSWAGFTPDSNGYCGSFAKIWPNSPCEIRSVAELEQDEKDQTGGGD